MTIYNHKDKSHSDDNNSADGKHEFWRFVAHDEHD